MNGSAFQELKWAAWGQTLRVFWILWWPLLALYSKTLRGRVALTSVRLDGFGAQIHARASVEALSRFLGIEYHEAKFAGLLPDASQDELSKLNEALECKEVSVIQPLPNRGLVVRGPTHLFRILAGCRHASQVVIINLHDAHSFLNSFPQNSRGYLKRILPRVAAPSYRLASDKETGALLHLRRGLMNSEEMSARLESSTFLVRAEQILRHHGVANVSVCAYELSESDIAELPSDWNLILGGSLYEVIWLGLTSSHFFAAKSSLSYCIAGARENGLVFYQPFWHPKYRDWKTLR